ncbi:TetR/AcrR family transcriptional regulator [Enterococcus larvae]|uniref:TetR/AcrR family transcriptional regulator n=1 Tax=Enterococcus larvae TaxID=2794352 RepID=UPI003F2CA9B8
MTIHEDVIERIISTTMELIQESDGNIKRVTTRKIAERANVAVGAINYYFRSKDRLIEIGLQRMLEKQKEAASPSSRTGDTRKDLIVFSQQFTDRLFEHAAISEIAILEDMKSPKTTDNTAKSIDEFLTFTAVEAMEDGRIFALVTTIQAAFLRRNQSKRETGVDLLEKEQRDLFVEGIVTALFSE